jgi:hypothetical protein
MDETRDLEAGLSGAPIVEVGELPRRDLIDDVNFVGSELLCASSLLIAEATAHQDADGGS